MRFCAGLPIEVNAMSRTPLQRAVLISSGSTCVFLGALALTGWYLRIPAWAHLMPSSNPMAFNAAVGFVLDGAALLAIAARLPRAALAGAVWSLLAGLLKLAEYCFSIELDIDHILVPNTLRSMAAGPGRLAPNSALCFVLCGVALFCLSRSRSHGKSGAITGLLGAVALALGATSILGYLDGLPTYVWGQWTQMAASSALGFVALGTGIVMGAWHDVARNEAAPQSWLALATGCAAFTVAAGLAYALARESELHHEHSPLAFAVLAWGAVGSTILALTVYLALGNQRRAEAMQSANRRLEREIAERQRAEQQLLTSEERFRSAFEEAPFGMLLSSLDGRLLQVNKTLCQMLGRSQRDLLASTWQELTHPDDLAASLAAVDQLKREPAASVEIEKRYIGAQGNIIWVRLRISLLRDSAGVPSHCVTHVEDITGRRRTETELHNREERFRNAFEHAPFGLCLAVRDRRILQVNATMCHMLGYSEEELLTRRWDDITHPEDVSLSRESLERLERDLLPWVEYEKRYLTSGGQIVWVRVRVSMAADAAEGWHYVAHIEDITERKRAEEAIRESEDRVRLLLDSTAEAIYGIDLDGNCTFANPACLRLLHYPDPQAVVGRNIHNLIHSAPGEGSSHPAEACRLLHALREGNGDHSDDEVLWRADGTSFPAEYWSHPVRKGGKAIGGVVTFLDITERRRGEEELVRAKEAAEAASRAKSRFLANMSHEIRTPMNGVIGMARLLLDTGLSPEQRHYAELVRHSAETLKSLLDHILDLSKIEAGKMTLESLDFDVREVLEGAVETLAIQASLKGLELTCLVSPDTPSRLRGDPGRLRQIVSNLAANAIKFTDSGDVGIRVRLAAQDGSRATLAFAIRDTGIGIPKDRVAALFSPFVQADQSTTRKFGGTGLGLAISKQLAELMGGQIGFESEEGKGSTFWFTAAFDKQTESAPAAGHGQQFPGVKTLVADRHRANREVVMTLLKSWECRPSEAVDGISALALLRQAAQAGDPFRIVLVDRNLPEAGGADLARQTSANPALRGAVLLLMAPLGEDGAALHPEAAGFAACVSKPVLEARLHTALATALGRTTAPEPGAAARPRQRPAMPAKSQYRILLAEDNPVNREVALAILGQFGFTADPVFDGAQAVKACETTAYDLVLMDCEMPEMDGYEATRLIRNAPAGAVNPRVPIVAVTASAMPGDRERCLRAGMDDYIAKPIEPDELAQMLAKWLGPPGNIADAGPSGAVSRPTAPDVFDEAGLLKRVMGNRQLAERLIKEFLHQIPSQLDTLRKQLVDGDAPAARRQAHTVKGAAANLSAGALRAAALEAERAAQAGQLSKLAETLCSLEQEFARVKDAMERSGWT